MVAVLSTHGLRHGAELGKQWQRCESLGWRSLAVCAVIPIIEATVQIECCVCTLDIEQGSAITLIERGWAHCFCVSELL
jgi:hypothetical protein